MASAETPAPLDTEHADPLLPTAQSIISPATRREAPNIADGAHEQAHDASHWLTKVFDRQAFLDLELRANEERQEFDDPRPNALYAPNRHFGGLPFSGAIAANHHTRVVQEAQTRALHLPQWEALPLYTANATNDPMAGIMSSLQAELRRNDASPTSICGHHVHIAALDDELAFARAPRLSQEMARLAKSVKPAEGSVSATMYALMYTHWTLFRWLLDPRPETYAEIPEIVRPSSRQIFTVHPLVVDFVHSPALRDYLCHFQSLTRTMRWILSACITITCEWQRESIDAVCRDGWTVELDLNPISKSHAALAANWSMGPTLREFLPNADHFWRIKSSTEE
ncbi:hypothetical protein Slin14017_G111740 [Septoria linicola]|nr:hypothetical protein Slin14017_G111740 [Septoria linicola]